MTVPAWDELEALFHEALARPQGERAGFLAERCGGRPDLQAHVEALLRAHENTPSDAGENRPPLAGQQLGPYRMLSPIGSGGMGDVYRAQDTKLSRPVAIKFLSDDLADRSARRRFQREAQLASSLNHPHIPTVHDAGEWDGRQYLVTEFVDGGTLREWTQRERRSWRQILELMVGVADALAAAHQAGILHRDIKPENILITTSGYAKLSDFGLAKLQHGTTEADAARTETANPTRPGSIVGTVAYMSPERATGQPLDARSDIFSFGVVLYELLAGQRPFTGASDVDVMHAIIHGAVEPLPEEVPLALRMVTEKALEKTPTDRYQSMRDLVVDLRRLTRQSASAIGPAATRRNTQWKRAAVIGTPVIVIAALVRHVSPLETSVLRGTRRGRSTRSRVTDGS